MTTPLELWKYIAECMTLGASVPDDSNELSPCVVVTKAAGRKLYTRRYHRNVLLLQHLDLCGSTWVSHAGLRRVSAMKRLVILNLQACHVKRCNIFRDFPTLTHLCLRGCVEVTDATNLSQHGLRSNTNMELSRIETVSRLQHLDLSGCWKITGASLYYTPMLTYLNLCGCDKVTDEGLRGISSLSALQRLDLTNCDRITGVTIGNLPTLTLLVLQQCLNVTDKGLRGISTLPQLLYLDVSLCWNQDQITDARLRKIAKVARLTHLNLQECKIAGYSLCDFPMLTHLSLRGCSNITDATNLNLHGITDATDKELSRVALQSQLRLLDLSHCRRITGASLYHIPFLTQ